MDQYFIEHMIDLSKKSEKISRYIFSDFLNLDEQNQLISVKSKLTKYELFGGSDNSERVICRFGDENTLWYNEPFPICCIKCEPLNMKFADVISHRDVLGAMMNLGIDRSKTGDIYIKDNIAYVFVIDNIATFITDNLIRIKHTDIKTEIITDIPDNLLYSTEKKKIITSSMRIDCILSGVYNLSRSKASEYITAQKVYKNGRTVNGNSELVSVNDKISVRGLGKFRLSEICGQTKKERIVAIIERYI